MIRQTFLGITEPSHEDAKAVIIPVPYDAMTSYVPGARFGPDAILRASQQIETYDEELKSDLDSLPIMTRDPLVAEKSTPEAMIDALEAVVRDIVEDGKMPVILGGDHSLSIAPTRFFAKKIPDLGILHIDAHTDLREEYEGSRFSHACAMRQAYELGTTLVQVGIRSTPQEVEEACRDHRKVFFAPHVPVDDIVAALPKTVYISIDVDAFDPSIIPATGTPEPGGLGWYDVLALLRNVTKERTIVGLDVVELSPIPGLHHPEFTIARLLTKLLGYLSVEKKL